VFLRQHPEDKETSMCGIVGYAGERPAKELLLEALERLEHRGYDSAGLCVQGRERLVAMHAVGDLENLRATVADVELDACVGIGHTRWATHGKVSVENAHPLTGCSADGVAVVLNGIVENFRELRASLEAEGHAFSSETDAEVVAHLVERHYRGDLQAAVRAVYSELEGHFAFVVAHRAEPGLLAGARLQCPLVVGVGEGEAYLASSIAAFLPETRRVQQIEEGEIVLVDASGARFLALDGQERERDEQEVDWDPDAAEKAGYDTFMLKEIHEQPEGVARTIGERTRRAGFVLEELGLGEDEVRMLAAATVISCGSSYHAGLVGRYLLDAWARLPGEADIASEWRYRDPIVPPGSLVVGISQSGETADTIAALRLARERGARTVAVTNMLGTQIAREADTVLHTHAGVEIGVAATKTFTAQVTLLSVLALELARVRGTLPSSEIERLRDELRDLPGAMAAFLEADHPVDEIALRHYDKPFFFFLGRHVGLPVCLEGALKLKELSYIPTEAYSAGEMKHGPIALLDESTPVVCVATDSHVRDKIVSNIQEVKARGAQVIAIATEGDEEIQHHADDVVYVPRTDPLLQPVLAVLPLQLLAYRIAVLRDLNVDRPRNLAKTVTVE
jgi:glucosamine--fructose-6-phosphate aminotransferase (isomerizing)